MEKSSKFKSIKAREILDSRKKPTIEVLVKGGGFSVKAGVPSGASKGKMEAKVINVRKAIQNINEVITPKLIGKDSTNQKEIDQLLIELDGTKDKSRLGANAICGVSMAVCRLGADAQNLPLWQYVSQIIECDEARPRHIQLPRPGFNVINGGVHAKNKLDIQEFMIVPQKEKFSENFKLAKKVYWKLAEIVKKKFGKAETGDEGGFSPPISSTKGALNLIKEASDGFKDIKIILDCAASQFQKGKKYKLEEKLLSKKELVNFYRKLISKYPIIGLEDPFGEEDFEGWKELSEKCKAKSEKLLIIGDDLLVTNPERMRMAKKENLCNGTVIKINQIGTVTEAIEAAKLAQSYGWKIMVSHRSGETLDDFIADFAVGVGADFIKSGAPFPKERMAKYNRLLEIEKELNRSA